MFDSDSFLYIAKKAGLSWEEMLVMDIGQVMDYIVEYANNETKGNEPSERKRIAGQADFDAF